MGRLKFDFHTGIGNWVADEVLYMSRIHPATAAAALKDTLLVRRGGERERGRRQVVLTRQIRVQELEQDGWTNLAVAVHLSAFL